MNDAEIEVKGQEMKELVVGVTAMITPTIMQCGQGGYIVVMPKTGIRACSTFEEALDVVGQYSRELFQAPSEGPRVLRKVWDQAKTRVRDRAADLDHVDVAKAMVAIGVMGVGLSILSFMGVIG